MHVFYALGGGWGHLSRVRAYAQSQGLANIRILTANPVAYQWFTPEQILWLSVAKNVGPAELGQAIQAALATVSVTHWYVDTFPGGILGELQGIIITAPSHTLLVRRLRWEAYAPQLGQGAMHYHRALLFEEVGPDQQAWLTAHVDQTVQVPYPAPNTDVLRIFPFLSLYPGPYWLVMHTSHQEEVESLWAHAQDVAKAEGLSPTWILLTDQALPAPSPGMVLQESTPWDWFPHVDRIFCGGGFNTLHQVLPYAEKVKAIPFPRRFDDQAERIRRLLS